MAGMVTNMRDFFDAYAAALNNRNSKAIAAFYAANFIAAGPKGAMSFKNDEQFIEWLKSVDAFNQQTGMGPVKTINVADERISDQYNMVSVAWGTSYKKTGDELITFSISYIVEMAGDRPLIVMYISQEDQEAYMQEKGLL